MTIPKLAIEKAIEGGWPKGCTEPTILDGALHLGGAQEVFTARDGEWFERYSVHRIALDPSFWRALGKALGWEEECEFCNAKFDSKNPLHCWCDSRPLWRDAYIRKAHGFYDLILTGGDTEKFWDELLAAPDK